jgi:hypothetical protein
MDFQEMRGRTKPWIPIKSMTAPNAIATPDSPATIPTGNDTIAIAISLSDSILATQ